MSKKQKLETINHITDQKAKFIKSHNKKESLNAHPVFYSMNPKN